MNRICTYGIYRKDMAGYDFLHRSFGQNSVLYKRTVNILGYKMYDAIFRADVEFTGNPKDKIVVDLLLVDDYVYEYMKRVRTRDYFEHLISIDYELYSIFIEWPLREENKEVEDGDWVKFNKNM